MTGVPCSPDEVNFMSVHPFLLFYPFFIKKCVLTESIDFSSVAQRYNILPHCRFNAMCVSLVWDDVRCLWVCTFQDTISGEVFKREAPVVASAVGALDRPYTPDIEGSNLFQGKIFHSATWDDSFQAKGKKITVLGNGASATQFVPELVRHVGSKGKVIQFVRSAHWWTERVSKIPRTM